MHVDEVPGRRSAKHRRKLECVSLEKVSLHLVADDKHITRHTCATLVRCFIL